EDGIRDFHVTGVQTCALPISALKPVCGRDAAHGRAPKGADTGADGVESPAVRHEGREGDVLDTGVNDWEAKALRLLGLALLVMCAAWLGIATRPVGFLATIWPANAVLLGLFILYPRLATPGGWLAALVGYVAADLLMGGGWQLALRLSLVNLVFVACGLLLARLTPKRLRSLDSHAGLLALLLI